MSFFKAAFCSALYTQLSSVRTWFLVLLLPLLTFSASQLVPAGEAAAPVQVGVVLPERGGEDFWKRLEERGGSVVTFHAVGLEEAERQVAIGKWDCALLVPDDFEARLERGNVEGIFTLITGPGSVVYPMVRETAAACAAECLSPRMAEDYLADSGIVDRQSLDSVRPRLWEVLGEQERVLVTMETLDGRLMEPAALADSGVDRLLSGLTSIFLLIWTLLTAMDLGRWLNGSFARRLTPMGHELLLPRLAAALVPALFAGVLSLLALERPLTCVLALGPYLLFWGAAALALARTGQMWSALPILLPFVPTAGLLLSPVLADLSGLFPALAPVIRWNPITLYLRTCDGHWSDGLLLTAAGMLLLRFPHSFAKK